MPTLTEQDVFTFDQLSNDVKDKAREWMRDLESRDFDTEFLMDDFVNAAKILGIDLDAQDIKWSGFASQGDGASFTGRYSIAADACTKIREEYHEATDLYAIADGLQALQVGHRLRTGNTLEARILQSGSYCHEMTMGVEVTDSETGEEEAWDGEPTKRLLALMRDFARWMYKSLEAEYDYRLEDEQIDETIRANEYQFDEDGDRI